MIPVSKKTALLAKKKRFDEECETWIYKDENCMAMQYTKEFCIKVPYQSDLQKWLRDVHDLHIEIIQFRRKDKSKIYWFTVVFPPDSGKTTNYTSQPNEWDYETALENGLLYALKQIK